MKIGRRLAQCFPDVCISGDGDGRSRGNCKVPA